MRSIFCPIIGCTVTDCVIVLFQLPGAFSVYALHLKSERFIFSCDAYINVNTHLFPAISFLRGNESIVVMNISQHEPFLVTCMTNTGLDKAW